MKYFHEPKIALESARREYTSVGSLCNMDAYKLNHACENVVREAWQIVTNEEFPKDHFMPYHRPIAYIKDIGLFSHYTPELQTKLSKVQSYDLGNVRYDGERAFQSYISKKSIQKAEEIICTTGNFINETEKLLSDEAFTNKIKEFKIKISS